MNKDIQEFESIYHASFEIVSKHVLFKIHNVSDAQDIVQDVFYDFYKHWLNSETQIEKPGAYLKTIANHAIADYYKKHSLEDTLIYDDDNTFNNIVDHQDLEQEVLDQVTIDALFNEIDKLKEPDKTIMVLRFRFGLSFKEIAEKIQKPESTIKSMVQKHLLNLKDKFSSKK